MSILPRRKPATLGQSVALDCMYPCHWDQVIAMAGGRLTEIELRAWHRDGSIVRRIAEHGDRVMGYAVYRRRPHSFTVLDFAVRAEARRQGVGRRLAGRIVEGAGETRRRAVHALIPEPDFDKAGLWSACLFWAAAGFVPAEHPVDRGLRGGPDVWRFTRKIGGME